MRVARAFDQADDYDAHAHVQRDVARALARRILDIGPREPRRILEIGCGTGFLGEELLPHMPASEYWMTDISPRMIERARRRFGARARYALMDGAAPHLVGPFDLICSSLALQWIADLEPALARLRAHLGLGGRLVFSTLAKGSFAEWRSAHSEEHAAGTPDYPSIQDLAAMGLDVSVDTVTQNHGSAADFLRSLKAIGAGVPRPGHRPLAPSTIKEVMAKFEESGAVARYVVATCIAGPLS